MKLLKGICWSAVLLLAPLVTLVAADVARKPNVLFIAVDDLRPELGCYGNPVIKTPNIDRIATRGMVFNHAYCQQAVCSPSRSSIMTGRRPDATRVWDLETHFRVALPDAITLPQHFKANGYYCAAFNKIYHHGFEDGRSWNQPHWYPSGQMIDTDPVDWTKRIVTKTGGGVKEYLKQPLPADNDKPNPGGKAPKGDAFEISTKSDDELPDGYTAAEAVKRIPELKAKGQPFFLAVGFLKPHLPFVAPKKYWDLYDPDKIPLPAIDHLPEGAPEFAQLCKRAQRRAHSRQLREAVASRLLRLRQLYRRASGPPARCAREGRPCRQHRDRVLGRPWLAARRPRTVAQAHQLRIGHARAAAHQRAGREDRRKEVRRTGGVRGRLSDACRCMRLAGAWRARRRESQAVARRPRDADEEGGDQPVSAQSRSSSADGLQHPR
jgi:hypothetical protein